MEVNNLLTVDTIFLCLAIVAITMIIRKICEFVPDVKDSRAWKILVLPLLALFIGAGLGFLETTIIHGLTCGLISTLVFERVKKLIKG